MITLSVERGLIRLKSWDDMFETPGYKQDIDPKLVQLKEIIGVYAFDTKQPCGLKTCRQPHANGYLVATTDGQLTNLGSVCGKNSFSVTFTYLRKAFDQDLKAKERRERLDSLKFRLPDITARLNAIKSDAAPFYTAVRHIVGDSGSLPGIIVEAVRRMRRNGDGAIVINRKATKAELEIALTTGNARPGMPFYVSQIVGRLANLGAITGTINLRNTLSELEPALKKLENSEVETMRHRDARQIDRITSSIDSRLEQLQQYADSLKIFATKQNLGQLSVLLDSQADKRLFSNFLDSLPST